MNSASSLLFSGAKYEVVNQSFPGNDERMSVLHQDSGGIVYVHCREEGCIGLYILDDQEISRGPRDVPRAKPEGNSEGRGVQNPRPREISRAEGMDFPIPPESW